MEKTMHCCHFLVVVAFLLLRQMNLIHTAAISDCDKYKFKVQYQYQRYCMVCQICPANVESKLHNAACKKKIPNSVPGQGYAWCTGLNDRSPWCPQLTVQYGRLNCDRGNDVYSTCSLNCDSGYMPANSNWTQLKCLDSLQWNIPDQSMLRCQRSAKPDKPKVSSLGQRQEVKSGSEKTLQCIPASVTVGKPKIYWYFKNKQLYGDSDLDIYVIHGTSKDNEGEYFCQVEDAIGKSELSAGYYLKVEETQTKYVHHTQVELIFGTLATVCGLAILIFLYCKRSQIYSCGLALWHSIIKWQHHEENETISSCLSSVASSMGGSSQSSDTTGTTDCGNSDEDSKVHLISTANEKLQHPQFILEIDKLQPGTTDCGNSDEETKVHLISAADEKLQHPQIILEIDNLKPLEISNRDNTVKLCPLTSALKDTVNETLHKSATRNDKMKESEHFDTTGIGTKGQCGLRLVFKDCKLMKRIITLLDQKVEINKDKPTFHSLGRYLGDSPDEISHFKFLCKQKELSPTETYIKRMIEEGQELNNLLTFLKQHKHTQELADDIEKTVSHLYHASVD